MVNPFICGSSSFSRQLEREDEDEKSRCSTPRKISPKKSRKSSLSRSKDDKNPYAKRGLDKFSALLAELEDTKQKIYTQIPSDDISLVRFTYSDTDHVKPIVVRVRDKKQENKLKNEEKEENKSVIKLPTSINEAKRGAKGDLKKCFSFKIDIWKPSFYLPAFLILILVFLALFGRSFAILCTSIGWYLLPTIKKRSLKAKRKGKKEYTRKASDKKITVNDWLSSPNTVLTEAPIADVSPPRRGCHRKRL